MKSRLYRILTLVIISSSIAVFIFGCQSKSSFCSGFSVDACPEGCSVCPNCEACSAISCQDEKACEDMGFDRSWYKAIVSRQRELVEDFYRRNSSIQEDGCSDIDDELMRLSCTAIQLQDISVCNAGKSTSTVERCMVRFAIINSNNRQICDKIGDAELKAYCFGVLELG